MTGNAGNLNKPTWLKSDTYRDLLMKCAMAPICAHCGSIEDLTVDHIVPRAANGSDQLSNLQVLCRSCNSAKGARPDRTLMLDSYFDNEMNPDALRSAQRIGAYEAVLANEDYFKRPWSQLSGVVYTAAWVVGAGKTLGAPVMAFALNWIVRKNLGAAAPRVGRMLVLCKERAIRDQIAKSLETDITGYGICAIPPRVGVVKNGWQLDNEISLNQKDIWVACIQQLFEENGKPRKNLEKVLAGFGLICVDEPHYATEQVLKIADAARSSLVFGFTGTPIDAIGRPDRRFVLLSVYDYEEANRNDRSLKFLGSRPEDLAEIIDEVGIEEAVVLERSEERVITETNQTKYSKQLEPARKVADAVLRHLSTLDRLGPQDLRLAGHRRGDESPSLVYPAHAIIVVEGQKFGRELERAINQKLDNERDVFPREQGYRAVFVHTPTNDQDDDAATRAEMALSTDHPWLRSQNQAGRVDADCARILIADGIGREGVNNPYCCVVGVACGSQSLVEHIQRAIGRQLRAKIDLGANPPLVPPSRLDTPRIVVHRGFNNRGAVEDAIEYVLNMRTWFNGMATIDDLARGLDDGPAAIPEGDAPISDQDKIGIAGEIGIAKDRGIPIDRDAIRDRYGLDPDTFGLGDGAEPTQRQRKRRETIDRWIEVVENDPAEANRLLNHDGDLAAIPAVLRETPKTQPSIDDLSRHIRTHRPELAPFISELATNTAARSIAVALFDEHARRFQTPQLQPWTDIEAIRQRLALRVFESLGDYYRGDRALVHQLVGAAIKKLLGVEDEAVRKGGIHDIPAVHYLLEQSAASRQVVGWVRGQVIAAGYCHPLDVGLGFRDSSEFYPATGTDGL